MTRERVVITGLGAISSVGTGAEINFARALAGSSGIGPLALRSARQMPALIAAQITFPLPDVIKKSEASLIDRFAVLALTAAGEALEQAGIAAASAGQADSGVFWGSGMGGAQSLETGYVDLFVEGKERVRPTSIVACMTNAAAAQIAIRHGFGGTVNNYSSACVSSAQAIGEAYRHIRDGYAHRVLAGGAEALLTYGVVNAWDALRVLARADPVNPERSCRPFSRNRSGLVLGEAGAALVLESLSAAKARGATILAELVGYGASSDCTHITKPDPSGQARAMRMALADAGLPPEAIDYINAHAAGTEAGDLAEAASIADVFGSQGHAPLVSSTKSVHGHTLGAAGALECVLTVQAVLKQAMPATAFLDDPDPACQLSHVPQGGLRHQSVQAAMSNSFAFGGSNVALIVKKFA